ncbi:hypothetical protein [Agromyces sp. C10]|uniref:hypothetical protein n=1 Tax=Agromyces sp. C10 TaxID=2935077 RepID=UPI00200A7EF3|nr:hypothetical protein [Agromyces sp. C10]MCK8609865.1 hypothetical protein [Agromyces sp. C10]
MSRLTIAALAAAIATSAIALTDAMTRGLTGDDSIFADGSAVPVVEALGDVVHIACYALLVAVLVLVAGPLFAGHPWRQILRWALVVAYGLMALGMAAGLLGPGPDGALAVVVTVGFFAMLLLPGVLGLTLLIQHDRSPSAFLLTLTLPAAVLMFVLPEGWAHPGYAETFANVGLALLGVGSAVPADRGGRVAAASAT